MTGGDQASGNSDCRWPGSRLCCPRSLGMESLGWRGWGETGEGRWERNGCIWFPRLQQGLKPQS